MVLSKVISSRGTQERRHGSKGAELLAVNTITEKIRANVYWPGQRLSEAQLSQDLGLSRNTVREALRRLAAQGIILFETNKGARVVQLGRQDVSELFQVREAIEALAAALCAMNINFRGHRDRAAQMLQEVIALRPLKESEIRKTYPDHNRRFHDCIVELSCNKYIRHVADQLNVPALRPAYFALMDAAGLTESLAQHEEIMLAILDGDAKRAETVMRSHVGHTAKDVHRLSDDHFFRVYGPNVSHPEKTSEAASDRRTKSANRAGRTSPSKGKTIALRRKSSKS